jgi:hypothetical protein
LILVYQSGNVETLAISFVGRLDWRSIDEIEEDSQGKATLDNGIGELQSVVGRKGSVGGRLWLTKTGDQHGAKNGTAWDQPARISLVPKRCTSLT